MTNLSFSTTKSTIRSTWVASAVGVLMTLATTLSLPIAATAAPVSSLPDGTYLYGESEKPNQPGSTYFIFEVKKGEVSGALYSPNSSFDCTHGRFEPQQIALTVVDTYEKTSYPIEIATAHSGISANSGNPVTELGLDGMTRVAGEISARDREILSTCKAYLAKNKMAK